MCDSVFDSYFLEIITCFDVFIEFNYNCGYLIKIFSLIFVVIFFNKKE